MSYVQIICERGHYHEEKEDYHHPHDDEHYRCHCGAKIGWSNHVDTSSGKRVRYLHKNTLHDMFFLHFIGGSQDDGGEAIYRIPKQEEIIHLLIDDEDPWDEELR